VPLRSVASTAVYSCRLGAVLAERGPGGLLPIGLVALAAVVYSILPGSGPTPGTAKSPAVVSAAGSAAVPEEISAEEDPLRLLEEFFDPRMGKKEKRGAPKTAPTLPVMSYNVRFLVATVPDPLDSHLPQSFDRAVDSIQRSVQESGYLLDRWFFPWKKGIETRWHLSSSLEDSPNGGWTATSKPAPRDLHRRTPGVLLFRSGRSQESELLVVFLVGEIPTAGIQREAFTKALDAIGRCKTVLPDCSSCESERIRLLAPYFSGSAESIRNALRAWDKRNKEIRILSGSATVDTNQDLLTFGSQGFHATVISDDALRTVFFQYLRKTLGLDRKPVALFVEGSTSYGSAAGDAAENSKAESPVRFVIQFPLHVSQLRQAYQKDDALRSEGILNRGPRRTLELPLETSESEPRDTVALQDPQITSNVAELSVAAGIETIRREHVRLVGIVATDPRDVLFIARKIREEAANVTLFTFGSDILFAHPDYQRFLRGMLIVTPYPLFSPNQRWTGAEAQRVAFSGSSEEGIYNAVALLLAENRKGGPPLRLMEYGAPDGTDQRRPPVWITAVGRGGFWPVKFDSAYENCEYVEVSPVLSATIRNLERWYWPPGAVLAFLLIDLVFASLAFFYFQTRVLGRGGFHYRAADLLAVWRAPVSRRLNRVYVVTLFSLALIVQASLLSWFCAAKPFVEPDSYLGLGLAGVLFLFLAAIVVHELQAFGPDRRIAPVLDARLQRWAAFLPPMVVTSAILWCLIPYLRAAWRMEVGDALAFAARALDLTSTISPIVPFLLMMLVLYLWTICNLQRAFLLEIQPPGTVPALQCRSLQGVEHLCADALDCLSGPKTRAVLLLAPCLALLPFFRTIQRNYTTIDGKAWSLLIKCLLVCCYFVIVYTFAVFVLLWIRLKRVLRRLAWHPLAEAFRRLPEACAATPWKLWNTIPNLTTLAASVAQLRAAANLGRDHLASEDLAKLEKKAKLAEKLLDRVFKAAPTGFAGSLRAQSRLRRVLTDATLSILSRLEQIWASWPERSDRRLPKWGSEERTLGIPDWKRREVPAGLALWARAAEEFVALRVSAFIRVIFQHMKNLLSFVFLGFLLVLAAISSYPFEPRHSVMALVWVVILASIGLITWVFIDMERDSILSYIGKSEPGKVTLSMNFLSSLGIYVIVPLLTLVATQFPGIGDVVFSIFSPAMRSLSH
jgi:hypothetical protein